MRRASPSLFSFFVAAGVVAAVAAVATPARAADSADECVNIRSAELGTGLSFDVQNRCEKRLTCALTWTLTCENASGKATSKTRQEARFDIAASDSHATTGSAASCKDGWKIDDVSWSCAAKGK